MDLVFCDREVLTELHWISLFSYFASHYDDRAANLREKGDLCQQQERDMITSIRLIKKRGISPTFRAALLVAIKSHLVRYICANHTIRVYPFSPNEKS